MHWVDKLERRFGRYAIPNLMAILLCGQGAVFAVTWLINAGFYPLLTLNRAALLGGQVWRLVSFLFVPLDLYRIINFLFGTYLLWFIGSALEQHWGSFRFGLYLLLGMVGCIAAALLTGSCTNYYLYMSLFLAFAMRFPDVRLMLFFIIPVKVQWLGWLAGAVLALSFIATGWPGRVQLLFSLLGFLLFFGPEGYSSIRASLRRAQWRRQNRNNWRR